MGDGIVDERQRRGRVAPFETDEGETGLGRPCVVVRGQERFLGAVEIALAKSDVAELGQRPSELPPHPRAELLAGAERLLLRRGAGPRHPEHLGPMDAAPTVDPADRRSVAPALHDLGPLAGPVGQHEPLGRADELAVHHPGGQRIGTARHEKRRDLVELVESLGHAALEDGHPCGCHPTDHHGRRHIETLAELDRPRRFEPCRRHVAGHEPLVGADHRDDRVRGCVVVSFRQALRPLEPAPHRSHQPGVHHQVHGRHRRGPRRLDRIVVDEEGVEVLERAHRRLEIAVSIGRLGP